MSAGFLIINIMIMIKKILTLSFVFLFFTLVTFSQDKSTATRLAVLAQKYNLFHKNYVQERVYIHTDNTAYFLGDTLWYKAYVTSENFHQLSRDSWTLYTELVSPEGQIIETKKRPLLNGQADCFFALDSLYKSGYYELRSYTRAMLCYGDGDVFSRVIPIFRQPDKEGNYSQLLSDFREFRNSELDKKTKGPISLSFYPEGGHLIQGLKNNLTIKAIDKEGKDVYLKGSIVDASNNEIGSFTTSHRGMALFNFKPLANNYKARCVVGENSYEFNLPQVQKSGIVARVNSYTNPSTVNINLESAGKKYEGALGLSITCRGKVYFLDIIEPKAKLQKKFIINKAKLSTGVHNLVLYDSLGNALIERKFFLPINKNLSYAQPYTRELIVGVDNLKYNYEPREKVKLNFSLKDHKGENL